MTRIFLLLVLLLPPALPAEEVLVPAELIHQLFETRDPNKAIPKRPFSFSELESLLSDRRFQEPSRARDLTRRYLAITYPAGLTNALDVARSEIDEEVREALFKAPPGTVRLAVPERLSEALDLLELLSPKLRRALLTAPAAVVVHTLDRLEITELLELSDQRFQRIVPFYRPNVTMQDAQHNRYLLSTPSSEHWLARLLEGRKAEGVECSATLESCEGKTCRTPKPGSSYASFRFQKQGAWHIERGDAITARCRYNATYRREYADRLEIEYVFERCELRTVNGEEPRLDPLLQDLSKVQ